jgi:hypothetical protein
MERNNPIIMLLLDYKLIFKLTPTGKTESYFSKRLTGRNKKG